MSRLSVKAFVNATLSGLSGTAIPLLVYSQRPKSTPIGDSAVVVLSIPEANESRMTLTRPIGQKAVDQTVRADVYWIAQDEESAGHDFDLLLDQIDQAFRVVALPQTLADPVTLQTSYLLFIGEAIRTTVHEPQVDATLDGFIILSAEKHLTVKEIVTG